MKKRFTEKVIEIRLILQRKLKAVVLGIRVRKKFRLTLLAVLSIQQFFSKNLGHKFLMNSNDEDGSIIIQKLWRGYATRRNLDRMLASHSLRSCPLYYQFKLEYLRLQKM